jgi:hypothetical protein
LSHTSSEKSDEHDPRQVEEDVSKNQHPLKLTEDVVFVNFGASLLGIETFSGIYHEENYPHYLGAPLTGLEKDPLLVLRMDLV